MGYFYGCFFLFRVVYVIWEKLLCFNVFLGNFVDIVGEMGGVSMGVWGILLWLGKKFFLGEGIMKVDDFNGVGGNLFIVGDIGLFIIEYVFRWWVESFLGFGFRLFDWLCDFVCLLWLVDLLVYLGFMIFILGGNLLLFRIMLLGIVNLVFVMIVCMWRGELFLLIFLFNKKK